MLSLFAVSDGKSSQQHSPFPQPLQLAVVNAKAPENDQFTSRAGFILLPCT